MVKIGLQFKAFIENVTGLVAEGEDFRWYLKLKCANCGEIPDHWQYIDQEEKQPLKGGRGEASAVIKCKLCSRENSIDILADTVASYDMADNNQYKTIVVFDCRGIEPVDFSPRNGWKVLGWKENDDDDDEPGRVSGTEFTDVDLTEMEWADYDERSGESTVISEVEVKFVTVK
eukprot:GFUD01085058.1.p1 GENE.GFUD01085058.1~~GFUD01085058.1.p1  ORF type:complete len:174 (+),score=41.90 GFUD01085058.1:49-570(+)